MSSRIPRAGLIILLLLAGCTKKPAGGNAGPVSISEVTTVSIRPGKVPNFSWKEENGTLVDFDTYRGRVTVVNFWATWCVPCRAELPDLISLSKETASKGVKFIGLSVDGGMNVAADLREFAKANGISYPIVIANRELDSAFGNIQVIPTTFIIDSSGAITRSFGGLRTKEVFREAIDAALH